MGIRKKNGDNWDLIYNNTNAGASASSTSDIDVVGDGAFTITLSNIAENGDYGSILLMPIHVLILLFLLFPVHLIYHTT